MITAHRLLRTWTETVDAYVALTDFAREKFIQGGLPAEKISVKPNFLHPDPGHGQGRGRYALFVGRLSVEKGVDSLLEAWERLGSRMPLKVVGDGPLASRVAEAAREFRGVEWLGRRPKEQALALMSEARLLICPSVCYENFPLAIVEAFGLGLPVIASDLGSVASLVDHGRTGLRFRPGDADDLVAKVEWVLDHPSQSERMRNEARGEYETKYTAEQNHQRLMGIYESATQKVRG
jgi:glycosyltransferase involved in cell wall biosynthesis